MVALKTENYTTNKQNLVRVHLVELEDLRKQNIEFRHRLHILQDLCDVTCAKKDEVKQEILVFKVTLDQ